MSASTRRPLKVGIMLPESEREMAGSTAAWSDFQAMARRADDLGFDSLWFADHLLMKTEGHEPQGACDCWAMLSTLAAATSRPEIGPRAAARRAEIRHSPRRWQKRWMSWPSIRRSPLP